MKREHDSCTFYKLLSLLLVFAVVFASIPNMAFAIQTDAMRYNLNADVWEGSADTTWYNTTDTGFTISTPKQLAGFAAIVNGKLDNGTSIINNATYLDSTGAQIENMDTFAGKTITLGADIVLNNETTENWTSTAKQWTPIGNSDTICFSGTFDGDGHTVSGLYISNKNYSGLFGYVLNGEVKNFTVSGSNLSQNCTFICGVAGLVSNSVIANCCNKVSVIGGNNTGGIVGRAESSSQILNCINTGAITANKSIVGGIVGNALYSTIQNCHNDGIVTCTLDNELSFAGGISGMITGTTIQNCYNTANVIAKTDEVGGIVAQVKGVSNVQNCYSIGSVYSASGNNYIGGVTGEINGGGGCTVKSVYFLKTATINTNLNASGYLLASYVTASSFGYFSGNTGSLTASNNTTLSYGTTLLNALNGWIAAQNDTTLKAWKIVDGENGGYPVFSDSPTLNGNWSDAGNYDTSWYFDANGTPKADKAFEISTPQQLAGLAVLVNGRDSSGSNYRITENGTCSQKAGSTLQTTNYVFSGVSITLTNDLMLNNEVLMRQWTPIGNSSASLVSRAFLGSFNGGGHTISGLYSYNQNIYYYGLFGNAKTGTLQNLTVTGKIQVSSNSSVYAGGIVGLGENLTIMNCANFCNINVSASGSAQAVRGGGIVGYLSGNSGLIQTCENYGIINLSNSAQWNGGLGSCNSGGIVGSCESRILECANYGTVSAYGSNGSYAGGIAATSSSLVQNCINNGSVSLNTSSDCTILMGAGGIIGSISSTGSIINCQNSGTIIAQSAITYGNRHPTVYAGGIAASSYQGFSGIKNCLNIGNVSAINYYTSGDDKSGGIAGNTYISNSSTIESCYSLSPVATTTIGNKTTAGGAIFGSGSATVKGCGTIKDSISPVISSGENTSGYTSLVYGTDLLSALNGWVEAQNDPTLKTWKIVEGENNGYPVLGEFPPIFTATELYYNGTNFYTDADTATEPIKNRLGIAYTKLQDILNDSTQELTIWMKANYTVSGTESPDVGTDRSVTIKRYTDYTGTLFTVPKDAVLNMKNLTVDGGAVWTGTVDNVLGRGTKNTGITAVSPLILISSGGTLNINSGTVLQNNAIIQNSSSAIDNQGTLNFTGGSIANNYARNSAAVYSSGQFTITGGKIFANSGSTGGAVFSIGTLSMTDGEIYSNYATSYGAVGAGGSFTMSGGTIKNNSGYQGGGVYVSGKFLMVGGSIIDNYAQYGGGMLINESGKCTVTGGTISGNTGVYLIYNQNDFILDKGADSAPPIVIKDKITLCTDTFITVNGAFYATDKIKVEPMIRTEGTKVVSYVTPFTDEAAEVAKFELTNSNRFLKSSDDSSSLVIAITPISATVPLNMTVAVKADGTVVVPDVNTYAIKSTSKGRIQVTDVSWQLVNSNDIFTNPSKLTLSLGYIDIPEGKKTPIPYGKLWAPNSDGINPVSLYLYINFSLGDGNYLKLADPTTATKFCTITYTIGYME